MNSPYPGYNKKQIHNKPTEAYFFLIKHIYMLIEIKKHIWISTKRVEYDVDGTIGHVNQKIQYIITSINEKELESINVTSNSKKEADNHKETSRTLGDKGMEKTSSTSGKEKKHVMVIFECMNAVNISSIQRTKARVQQRLCVSVRWKSLCQSTNMIKNTWYNILSFIIKSW